MTRQEFRLFSAFMIFGLMCVFLPALGESRMLTQGEDRLKPIRSACDKTAGNLIYQSESKYVSDFEVVPGGCQIEPSANMNGWRLVVPEEGKFRAIWALCDLPTGNLVYESESSWVSPIRVVHRGCIGLLNQSSPTLSQPARTPVPTPGPK